MTRDAIEFYRERFGITPADVDRLLGVALARGGDFADLYFEYTSTGSVQFEEQIVKTATRSVRQGVGVRVVVAERTGFAYTDSIDVGSIERAARTASSIARSGGSTEPVSVTVSRPPRDLYPVELSATDVDIAVKIEMLQNADAAARVYDRRIREVQAGVTDVFKIVMIATSEGVLTGDVQPMVRFGIHC
ncbi:MAG: DNA gyrase modulator, partial [Blastocatellia bacterium]